MIKFSRDFVEQYFATRYKRGVVVRFNMECDDPNREKRFKFGIVLNRDCSEPDVLLAIATSNTDKFASGRFDSDILRVPKGSYGWTTEDTVVDLRVVRSEKLDDLKLLCERQEMRFEDLLSAADAAQLDQKLRASRLLEIRLKKRVVD